MYPRLRGAGPTDLVFCRFFQRQTGFFYQSRQIIYWPGYPHAGAEGRGFVIADICWQHIKIFSLCSGITSIKSSLRRIVLWSLLFSLQGICSSQFFSVFLKINNQHVFRFFLFDCCCISSVLKNDHSR